MADDYDALSVLVCYGRLEQIGDSCGMGMHGRFTLFVYLYSFSLDSWRWDGFVFVCVRVSNQKKGESMACQSRTSSFVAGTYILPSHLKPIAWDPSLGTEDREGGRGDHQ